MAKKKTTKKSASRPAVKKTKKKLAKRRGAKPAAPVSRAERDKHTIKRLHGLADGVVDAGLSGDEPRLAVPQRTASNTRWDEKNRILRMGDGVADRRLFDLKNARTFMQTLLHAQGIGELIDADKTLSLRGMFYKGLACYLPFARDNIQDAVWKACLLVGFQYREPSGGCVFRGF